jgi:CRISPR-associated protein Cmr2
MRHILIIALGPVQDFIAAARRCRDLWFGSWLLSELSKATARAVKEAPGAELVFPSALADLRPGSETSVANKVVARLAAGTSPSAVAERGREAMLLRLSEIRDRAFLKIVDPGDEHFCREVAAAQLADLIEYVWASAAEEPDYRAGRRAAEALLGARKNTHLWQPVSWGSAAPKSSLDGERESVIHERAFDKLPPAELRRRFGLGKRERLCGVGLLKRHGTREGKRVERRYGHHFLSTGHLAAWPLLARMERLPADERAALQGLWERFLATLAGDGVDLADTEVYTAEAPHPVLGRSDGGLLFESRVADLFEDRDPAAIEEPVRRAREALGAFLKRLGILQPWPYYAILVGDGDCMGLAIERQETVRAHQELSRALDSFAREVPKIVEAEHGGELIYAGGDDVLAFVPLHRVLSCAQALALRFGRKLQGFPAAEGGAVPTLSVGIGIGHFLDPMSGVLALARRAERLAKTTRNALAVIVDKRSGPAVETRGPWGTVDRDLADFVRMHRCDAVPDGAAYELRELVRLLDGAGGQDAESLASLVRKEAERILRKKQPQHGRAAQLLQETLASLVAALDARGVPELANRLILARTLARAEVEANPYDQEAEEGAA